jgi:hypothetical protein
MNTFFENRRNEEIPQPDLIFKSMESAAVNKP